MIILIPNLFNLICCRWCPMCHYFPIGFSKFGSNIWKYVLVCFVKFVHERTRTYLHIHTSAHLNIFAPYNCRRGSRYDFTTLQQDFIMEPPTMLLVPICRDMQLWWDKPPIPSPRKRMPGETCFDDVGRICACVTWTQMYKTLQTKNVFHSKGVVILFLISLFVSFFPLLIST